MTGQIRAAETLGIRGAEKTLGVRKPLYDYQEKLRTRLSKGR